MRLTQAIVAGWQLVSVRYAVAETYRSLAAGDLEGLVRRRPEVVRNLVLHLCANGQSDLLAIPRPEFSFSSLDEWEGFVRVESVAGSASGAV